MFVLCVCAKLLFCDPMDCSLPGSSVHGFSRQEYWSGLPCPPPGDLPNPGFEPRSLAFQVDSLLSEPPGKPLICSKWLSHFQSRVNFLTPFSSFDNF